MSTSVIGEGHESARSSSGQSTGLLSREPEAKPARVRRERRPVENVLRPGTALVPLTRGLSAVIDSSDAPAVGMHTWSACPTTQSATLFYATASIHGRMRKLHHVLWELWGLPKSRLDHANGDPLDNRRENLRPVTYSQNGANAKTPVTNTSGHKGVSRTRTGKWRAQIRVNGKARWLGTFATPGDAAAAYWAAARAVHGEFARAS